MENNKQEILDMIDSSFLSDADKNIWRERCAREQVDESFAAELIRYLEEELRRRGAIYEKIMPDFDEGYAALDREYAMQRQDLDTQLERAIENIDPENISEKQKIFDRYYDDVSIAQQQHEKKARDWYAGFSTGVLKNILRLKS